MQFKARQDLIGGLAVAGVGLAAAIHAAAAYDIGTPGRMGPGFFPLGLGLCMTVLGLMIAGFGARDPAAKMRFDLRAFSSVIGAMAAFAMVLPLLGLLPATMLLVVICLMASRPLGLVATLVTAGSVAAVAILVFRVGLNIQLPTLRWPL